MTSYLLLQNQWRLFWRSSWRERHWAWLGFVTLVALSAAFLTTHLGLFLGTVLHVVRPGVDPVVFVNRNLITIFLLLFTVRFFVQQTPRMKVQPYLHLPISRGRLVLFFQFASLASIHNVIPFLFFVPFWARYILGGAYPPVATWGWLAGVVLLVLLSHYANNLLRSLMSRSRRGMFVVLGVVIALVMFDLLVGSVVLRTVSLFIFGTLIAERPWMLGLLAAFVGTIFGLSTYQLLDRLHRDEASQRRSSALLWRVPFVPALGRAANLVLLEAKLIWRCERPKLYFLFSIVFGTIYVAGPLISAELYGRAFIQAFVGVFASGIFALNYGQLMFSWESSYFDGLLTRALPLRTLVLAKILLLQGSCVLFFLVSLPIFAILAPGLIPLHVAFLLYNVGVTCLLVLLLALTNRKRITLGDVSFFNFEGFSIVHWLWFIPTAVPPALLLYVFDDRPQEALLILAAVGLAGAATTGWWSTRFARQLAAHRYAMARGFRRDAD